VLDLGARAGADAQDAGLGWQRGEDRTEQQVQAVAQGGELGPLLVVARGLAVEGGFDLVAVHVRGRRFGEAAGLGCMPVFRTGRSRLESAGPRARRREQTVRDLRIHSGDSRPGGA
jgi:hypothetical protein